ncbi:uncharacterized protein LOC117786557 [Drosophila innubila]|uniref:uncharacterized protein LOC117786557 n=1 Tax=Drosophila innubila TaxID=198719 RepID=UPI00148D4868|nr:uncharacterized protein LOC117786557 [Drosophila innubila]
MRCAVSNCGNNNRNSNRNKWRYFHFPKDKQQMQKWIKFCERDITNTATACICNEHFTPDDFERNMQYELGFARKNPTKLKPGSCPTIHGPNHNGSLGIDRRKKKRTKCPVAESDSSPRKTSPSRDSNDSPESALVDCLDEIEDIAESVSSLEQNNEVIEYTISEMEEYSVANNSSTVGRMELEIIDPLDSQTNSEDDMEIIDSESDNYVKHLETEVITLRREVFFLKDERKKLINEIKNLRATVRNAREKESNALEKLISVNANGMITKNIKGPTMKKTVIIYTENINKNRKLRKITNSTD